MDIETFNKAAKVLAYINYIKVELDKLQHFTMPCLEQKTMSDPFGVKSMISDSTVDCFKRQCAEELTARINVLQREFEAL